MKYVILHLHGANRHVTYMFRDHALADLGYEKIKTAMDLHREFGNDRGQSVSVKGDDGSEFTLKLDHVSAVGIENPEINKDLQEAHIIRTAELEKLFRQVTGIAADSK